jgi:hypothetical protein
MGTGFLTPSKRFTCGLRQTALRLGSVDRFWAQVLEVLLKNTTCVTETPHRSPSEPGQGREHCSVLAHPDGQHWPLTAWFYEREERQRTAFAWELESEHFQGD